MTWKNPFEDQSPGRVVGGLLEGTVQVTGPDNLTFDGIDFHFSEAAMRIWCDNDVRSRFRSTPGARTECSSNSFPTKAVGNGRSFCGLGRAQSHAAAKRRHELRPKPDEKKPARPTGKPAPRMTRRTGPSIRAFNRAGSFSFVLESNVATFEDNVSVKAFRPEKSRDIDELLCDLLTLVFSRENESPATSPQTADAPREIRKT